MKKTVYSCDNCKNELQYDEDYYLALKRKLGTRKKQNKDVGLLICLDCFNKIKDGILPS